MQETAATVSFPPARDCAMRSLAASSDKPESEIYQRILKVAAGTPILEKMNIDVGAYRERKGKQITLYGVQENLLRNWDSRMPQSLN